MFSKFKVLLLYATIIYIVSTSLALAYNDILEEEYIDSKRVVYDNGLERARLRTLTAPGDPQRVTVYCWAGEPKRRLSRLFTTVTVQISSNGDGLSVHAGRNATEALSLYRSATNGWLSWLSRAGLGAQDSIAINTFNQTCLAVHSPIPYSLRMHITLVDPLCVLLLLAGIILFFTAYRLSRSVCLYYTAGVGLGVLASVLIVLVVLSRILPRRSYALLYGLWVGGGSLVVYAWKSVYDNLTILLEHNLYLVLAYLGVSAAASFAFCYYRGPPQSPRTLDLLQWSVQLGSAALILVSTHIPEVSALILAAVVTLYLCPPGVVMRAKNIYRRRFPQKRRLLTQDEYEQQAQEATRQALHELKEYCKSPECDAWKTVSRLHDPHRFSAWMSGDADELHVSAEESFLYDSDPCPPLPAQYDDDVVDVIN